MEMFGVKIKEEPVDFAYPALGHVEATSEPVLDILPKIETQDAEFDDGPAFRNQSDRNDIVVSLKSDEVDRCISGIDKLVEMMEGVSQ